MESSLFNNSIITKIMNNTAKILTAFAIGAAAGAILGILYAPEKGTETRKKMNEEGKKMSDALKNKYNEVKEKINSVKEELENNREQYV
jgi:gas vesicle protein